MKDNFPYLYPYSRQDAERQGELELWRESHRENIACKEAIESAIRSSFDGMHLQEGCVSSVIEQYGFRRVAWVLSNTIQQKSWDGRFSSGNRAWAEKTFIPVDESRNRYVVESHSTVLNGFVSEYRKAVQALNLFGAEHCEPDSYAKLDYEGKVLVLSPDTLRESCWNRAEFVGVLKEEHLPDWAMDKLEQMRSQEAEPLQLSL